jgi:hypothetical protein
VSENGWARTWVHGNTTSLWPAVPLDSELVVGTTSLEEWLVDTSTSSNDTDGSASIRRNSLLGTRRQTDTRDTLVEVVSDNRSVVARSTCERSTVTDLLLHVAHNGTFGQSADGQHVADVEASTLAAVDELASGHALGSDKVLGAQLVPVRVTEGHLGEGGATVEGACMSAELL